MKRDFLRLAVLSSILCVTTVQAQTGTPPPPPDWPLPIQAADVSLNASCLAGNGRIDLNIVNRSSIESVYRLEFQGLSARERTILFADWGRIKITGRRPGTYSAVVKRDADIILDTFVTINCASEFPPVTVPEVSVINACRDGNGQVFFQFVNPRAEPRSYVIEFDNVPNRSTTAAAFGQALRGTTGRPDGTYNYMVRSFGSLVDSGSVTVSCD